MESVDELKLQTATPGYRLRPSFVEQMNSVAHSLDLEVDWLSDYWVCILSKDGVIRCRVTGGYFPLNTASAAQLANDKAATSETLRAAGIAAVPHVLLRPQGRSAQECTDDVLLDNELPLVVKPNLESGGVDVHLATSTEELARSLAMLGQRYRSIAVSPYRRIASEARIVVLDDRARIAFTKERPAGATGARSDAWQHNLRLGAQARLVDLDSAPELAACARSACQAIGLRFATVDVVSTDLGVEVLEVNSSVTLDRFSRVSSSHWRLAQAVYQDAVRLAGGQ